MVDGSDLARAHAGSARAAERLAANGALLGNSEAVARICHEVNRAICIAFGHDVQPSWDGAPDWQRDSAIKGVQFAVGNPDAPASAQHDAWTADKVAAGWTYGPTKDAEAKTHPCLVPYDELPADQRVKDHAFQAVVAAARRLSDGFDRKPDSIGKPAITRAEADAGLSDAPAPRVTVEDMEAKVASAEYFRSKTLTICILTLANGFTIVGKSACASPENYDQAKGERYAYDDAFRQIGAFEGYLLRERLAAEQAA